MPEFFASKFKTTTGHPVFRFLAWLEQAGIQFADSVITCTEQMRETFIARGAPREKVDVVMNSSDEAVFDATRYPRRERRANRFVIISHGSVEERYGLDTGIEAIGLLKDEIPGLRLEIYGEGSYVAELKRLASNVGVQEEVYFSNRWVPLDDLLQAISRADAGLVAIKRDAFRDLTHCNKMFEFIAMDTPAIVSRTRSVEECFDESCFKMFTSNDPHDLARAIRELEGDPELAEAMARRAAQVATPYAWAHQRDVYKRTIERVLSQERPPCFKHVALAARRRRRARPAASPSGRYEVKNSRAERSDTAIRSART
jgi:glycosyltransferase involved in cell wall biosynthesis